MANAAFAVPVASSTARAPGVHRETSPAKAASFRPRTVAPSREAAHRVPIEFPLSCSGGGSNGGRSSGGGRDWSDRTPDGNGRDGLSTDSALIPLMDKLLRGSSPVAALAGYSVSTLLEERNPGGFHLLSTPDLREAGLVGLFGLFVHGLGGSCFYTLLDEIVAGSTPIPVAIKTCVDALLFLPFVANSFDRFVTYASSSRAPEFLRSMQGREHSSVHLLRNRALWVPAQAISFWFLPPWWRVGYVSIIMVFVSFLQLVRSSPGAVVVA